MMTLDEAKEVGKRLKTEYGFGTSKCPQWFNGISIALQQDNSYEISICVPDLALIPNEERDKFSSKMDGFWIGFRVVRPMKLKIIDSPKTDNKVPITKVEQ